jgi:antitoxin YefM
MKRVNVLHDIVPLTEFRARTAELIDQMKRSQSPLVLTQHGRAVAVVMPPAEYEELAYREELIEAIKEAEVDLDAGKGIPHEEVMAYFAAKSKARGVDPAAADSINKEDYKRALDKADANMAAKNRRPARKGKRKKAAA